MSKGGIASLTRAALCGMLLLACAAPTFAADKVHAGKSVGTAWAFIPLDVGLAEGIFAKYGIDEEISAFTGDAKLQQAMASGSIDFGVGSGPSMAFAAKGSPVIAVAAFAAEPRSLAIVIAPDSTIKSVADLKGKTLAVTTVGSLTDWLVKRMSVQEGWGTDGIKTAALGGFDGAMAAFKTHQIDGFMAAMEVGYMVEDRGQGRILTGMESFAPKFHTHVVFARKTLVAENPGLVGRFLKGFFTSIAFMKANKAKTTEIAASVLHQAPSVMNKTYDYEISILENDGHFDPDAIAVIKDSFVGMGLLTEKPSDDQLFTTRFVPVKP